MRYDFDGIIPRRGSNSIKWDGAEDDGVLPMWVADMDFPTAPAITEALQKRVAHGVFGYTKVPDEYYESVIAWFKDMHGVEYEKEWFIYTSGVVPAISAIIKALTVPGDKVILQTPVYNCFFSSIRNNGCEVLPNPLIREGDSYRMDFEDLETKAADDKAKILILCNPHNPAGRVWTAEEMQRLGDICLRNNVMVIADEIHCEFVYGSYKFIPFASISNDFKKRFITCTSPTKAFNIAGLQIANIIVADDEIRARIDRAININEVCDVNPFGVIATIAAYGHGREWLSQLVAYIKGNYDYMKDYCGRELPGFHLTELQGTYLVWMDCRSSGLKSEELEQRLISEAKLWLNAGSMYGNEGEGFMRWNIACPRSVLQDGLQRFKEWVGR